MDWRHVDDHGYAISGEEEDNGLFSTRRWLYPVHMFVEAKTEEVKFFTARIVQKKGIDQIIKELNEKSLV